MGGAKRAAARRDKSDSVPGEEARDALIVGRFTDHDMMVRDRTLFQPARCLGDRRSRIVQEHKPECRSRMNFESEAFGRIEVRLCIDAFTMYSDKHDLISLADGLSGERSQLRIGEIKYEMVASLLAIKPTRDGVGGKFRIVGECRPERRGIYDCDLPKTRQRLGDLVAEAWFKLRLAGGDDGD